MTAKDYIQEHIPTMVGEHHVSSMKLTTLISLLNGYASQSKSEISDLKKQLADMTANRIFDYEKSEVEIYNLKKQLDASQSKWVSVDLEKSRVNAEEDYPTTPISVLKYITVLEQEVKKLEGEIEGLYEEQAGADL